VGVDLGNRDQPGRRRGGHCRRVIDVYALAGVETSELSVLSDESLDGIAHQDKPNMHDLVCAV